MNTQTIERISDVSGVLSIVILFLLALVGIIYLVDLLACMSASSAYESSYKKTPAQKMLLNFIWALLILFTVNITLYVFL